MDFSSGYMAVPKQVQDSLVQTSQRVRLAGTLNLKDFETEFRTQLSAGVLNTEKAVQIGLKNPSQPLTSIQSLLKAKIPLLY